MSLSKRGDSLAKMASDLTIWQVIQDLWDPASNPSGFVSLGVAENSLMHKEFVEYSNKHTQISPSSLTYGDGGNGSRKCRDAMAHFLNRKLHPAHQIESSHVCITNGVSTAIEHLSTILSDPNDVFLLGQPHYGAFIHDLELRTGAEVVKVSFGETDPLCLDAVLAYSTVIKSCQARGKRVAGLMLCNPHNPLGRCYPREYIIELMKLCDRERIHLISDEIYALSVFQESGTPFTSLLSIPPDGLIDPSLTHVLYGLSKDFGANGIRMGALISQHNPQLHQALTPISIYSYVSSLAESLTTKLLYDDEWVDWYIAENHQRLKRNYDHVVHWAESHNIEYHKGVCAAFFLWVNFGNIYERQIKTDVSDSMSQLNIKDIIPNGTTPTLAHAHDTQIPELTTDMIATEADGPTHPLDAEIQEALLAEKVFLASGTAFGSEKPGWFRVVFSQEDDILSEGLRRIERALDL